MLLAQIDFFHGGEKIWRSHHEDHWFQNLLYNKDLEIVKGNSGEVRKSISAKLTLQGWASPFPVSHEYDLKITAKKDNFALQIQTGNISRVAYDYLKLQYLYENRIINAACLIVPTKDAANIWGTNYANYRRIQDEMRLFDRIITIPLALVAFE